MQFLHCRAKVKSYPRYISSSEDYCSTRGWSLFEKTLSKAPRVGVLSVRMSPESPILISESQSFVENEFGNEWEPIASENESTAYELPHDESTQEAFLSPVQADLLLFKGGFPEDWERVDSGEGFTLDSGAVRNNETGEAWQGFSEDDIEQLQQNGFVRLDTVVVDGKEVVTYLIRGPENSVHYEMYAADIRESVDEIDLNYDRYEPGIEHDVAFVYDEEPDVLNIPGAIVAPEILSLASAHVEEEIKQEAQQEIIVGHRDEVAVPPDMRAEKFPAEKAPEREYSHAAVIESLAHLAVFRFEEGEIDPPVIPTVAEQAPTVEMVRPYSISETPAAREVGIPMTLVEQEIPTFVETMQPEKRAETIAEPTRATVEMPVASTTEATPASPTLETLAAAPEAPHISAEDVHIQEAVQQLLAEPSLEAFFEEKFEEEIDQVVPAAIAPLSSTPDIIAAEEATPIEPQSEMPAPAIEIPRAPAETIVSRPIMQTQIASPRTRISEEIYMPAREMTLATLERVANDNELATKRFAFVGTKEATPTVASAETLHTRRVALSQDDLLPASARPTSNPSNFTSRNGISLKIAA